MVFDPARPVTERRILHRRRATAGAHRCFHRRLQRDRRAIRLDEEEGLPAPIQRPTYHSTLIPGTSSPSDLRRDGRPNERPTLARPVPQSLAACAAEGLKTASSPRTSLAATEARTSGSAPWSS